MKFLQSASVAVFTIIGVCCTVYLFEVASDYERHIDKYTLSVRKAIRQIPTFPKNVSPYAVIASVNKESIFRAVPKRRLELCMVKQNMDKILQGTLCYLFDTEEFLANNATIRSEEWKTNRFCSGLNEFGNTSSRLSTIMPDKQTIFITRDPFERFANWYLENCENNNSCYGCDNVLCTVENLHESILKTSKTFKTTGGVSDADEVLLSPQTWNCDLWERGKDATFIKYSDDPTTAKEAIKSIIHIFQKNGVSEEKLDFINESLTAEVSREHNNSSRIEELRRTLFSSKQHLDLLVNAYYYDYVVFDYPLPTN